MHEKPFSKVAEYDGLRGVLSTMVVVAHLYLPFAYWVWWTMDMFFCLSGFLVGSVLLNGLGQEGFLHRYAVGRVLRIWPSYYCCLLACWASVFMLAPYLPSSDEWLANPQNLLNFFFIQNLEQWFRPTPELSCAADAVPFLCHGWSVALEEQFYFVAPMLCWLMLKIRARLLLPVLLAATAIAWGIYARSTGWHWWTLPARLDGFALGLLLAHIRPGLERLNYVLVCAFAAVGLLAVAGLQIVLYMADDVSREISFGKPVIFLGVSLASLAGFFLLLLIYFLRNGTLFSWLRFQPFQFLGRMSYSTYLWHWPVVFYSGLLFSNAGFSSPWLQFLIQLLACYATAYIAYRLVEKPFMDLKKRDRHKELRNDAVPAV